MTGATSPVQTKRKTKAGRVVSDKMDKTIVVSVERLARHPLYKRVIRLTTKFKAHDEAVEAMRLASHKLPVATRVVTRDGAKEAGDGHH